MILHRSPHRRGVTLVETVAALVILGTLVAMALSAQARLVHQWNAADMRIEAAKVADDLLSFWWDSPGQMPHQQEGVSTDHPGWRWRTVSLQDAALLRDRMEVVRLSIFAPPTAGYGDVPLAEIELLTSLDGRRKQQ